MVKHLRAPGTVFGGGGTDNDTGRDITTVGISHLRKGLSYGHGRRAGYHQNLKPTKIKSGHCITKSYEQDKY